MLERSHVGRQPCALHRGQGSVTTKMASHEEIAREMEQETRLIRELTDPIKPVYLPRVLVGQLQPQLLVPNFAR